MNATNLITWDRYATLADAVAERPEVITAPILAKLAASKRLLDAPHEPLSPAVYADLTRAMLRGYGAANEL